MSVASTPTRCFHRSRDLGDLLFSQVDSGVCWFTDDFVDGHGCDDGMRCFADIGFIGRWQLHGFGDEQGGVRLSAMLQC